MGFHASSLDRTRSQDRGGIGPRVSGCTPRRPSTRLGIRLRRVNCRRNATATVQSTCFQNEILRFWGVLTPIPEKHHELHRACNLSPRSFHHLAEVALQERIRLPRTLLDHTEARRRAPMTALWEARQRSG